MHQTVPDHRLGIDTMGYDEPPDRPEEPLYIFTVYLEGYGNTPEEAREDAKAMAKLPKQVPEYEEG